MAIIESFAGIRDACHWLAKQFARQSHRLCERAKYSEKSLSPKLEKAMLQTTGLASAGHVKGAP